MINQALGQRQTRKRDAILQVITESDGPLSVPEILARAQQMQPQLGIATVYRTLKLLMEKQRIQIVILPSGETRYESAGLGHHHHFQCRRCQQVFDFSVCPLQSAHTELPAGFLVEDHEITLYGQCADCSAKPAKSASAKPRRTKRESG